MSGIVGGIGAFSGVLGETTVPTIAGTVKEVSFSLEATDSGDRTISNSTFYGFGTIRNMILPAGQTVLIQVSGGMVEYDGGTDWGPTVNTHTSSHSSATEGTFHKNTGTNNPNTKLIMGPVGAFVANTTTATITVFYRLGMKGWSSNVTARWYGDASAELYQFIKVTRYVT